MTILTDDNPILRQKSEAVPVKDINTKEMREFVASLWNTMVDNNGVGIAAVQVGVLKKVICINTVELKVIMFNPKIVKVEGKCTMTEGCLSFPDKRIDIERHDKITVTYRNIVGKVKQTEFRGFVARVIQHEIDHTNGIVFTEK